METRVAATHSPEALAAAVAGACRCLEAGEVVALPTETVYGLAADALSPAAVLKIFEAKERPFFDPLIVHLPAQDWLSQLTELPARSQATVAALTARFWPGPLTLVLPRSARVPDLVTSGLETVAVRMSAHPVFGAVVKRFAKPLAAPSANRFGRISPTCAAHVQTELGGRIGLIVDGGMAVHGVESTIVAVDGTRLCILRSGPITLEELREFGQVSKVVGDDRLQAPGQLPSHYAPRTPLTLLEEPASDAGSRVGLLAFRAAPEGASFGHVEVLSTSGDLREAASVLFAKLRRLDEVGLDRIVAERVPETGLGVAIMDRLRRAAHRV